jgi:hypothetical protein
MPALVSYWEGANLHFPLNQYSIARLIHFKANYVVKRVLNARCLSICVCWPRYIKVLMENSQMISPQERFLNCTGKESLGSCPLQSPLNRY